MFTPAEIDSVEGVIPRDHIVILREAATGRNYKEIGLRIGLERRNVSGRLQRARQLIAEVLEKRVMNG